MRGTDQATGSLLSYVDLEERIPARHPLRKIRQVVNDAAASLDAEFDRLYAAEGRPSIAPERLIRASLIQILLSIRSERQLMEQMQYNLLFRWFAGLGIDDPAWVPAVFTKNRDRLLTTSMSREVMAAILAHREVTPLLSDDHFSVDGALIKAWASMKSFQPKPDSAPPDDEGPGDPPVHDAAPDQPARSEPGTAPMPAPLAATAMPRSTSGVRSVRTPPMRRPPTRRRASTGNPRAPARCCALWAMLSWRTATVVVQGDLTQADGHAERRAALDMVHRHSAGSARRPTLGADKGYDSADLVAELRQACVTPHVARKARRSAIDGHTTRHGGYAQSRKRRKRIEEAFGRARTVGGMPRPSIAASGGCGPASS